jgi:4-amino-4-deoxy-L-arabinose transferase-like glycosyltransferase
MTLIEARPPHHRPPPHRLADRHLTGVIILILLLTALRCWVAGHMDFETDETYYWLWSQHPALSFYDHPPMVAWFIRLGTWFFGHTALGVRSMAIFAMLGASALVYGLAFTLFDDRRIAATSLLWFAVMPHTSFFSNIIFPDTPALLFWILGCYALARIWRSGHCGWWYLAGLAFGLTMISKYTGLLLIAAAVAWILFSPAMRAWLRRREPYLAALVALAVFSPVLWWNAGHDWASFAKQFGRVLDHAPQAGLANAGAFVGIQAAFVSPLMFVFALAGTAIATRRGLLHKQANWLLLALASAPMLLFFLLHALTDKVLPQWPSAAYPTAIVAAVAAFQHRAGDPASRRWPRWGFAAAPWLGLAMSLGMYLQMTLPLVPVAAARDPFSKFIGWQGLAEAAGEAMRAEHAGYIATREYGTNSILVYYLPRDTVVFQASEPWRYTNLPPVDQAMLAATTGLFLTSANADKADELRPHFNSVELIATIQRGRTGDPIEAFHLYRLTGYRGGVPY